MIEHLFSMHEVLGSIPSTHTKMWKYTSLLLEVDQCLMDLRKRKKYSQGDFKVCKR